MATTLLTAEQAAEWLLIMQSEQLTAAQRAELVDWLRASPMHISELLRICQLEGVLSSMERWPDMPSINDSQSRSVLQLLREEIWPRPPQHRRSVSRRKTALIAATATCVLAIGWSIIAQISRGYFRTGDRERRELTMVDGSVIDLAPDSEVRVRYRPRERLIELKEGGALFQVAKDRSRPFIVRAGQTEVRAVGTVFDVERRAQSISVTVVEGRVAVSAGSAERASHSGAPEVEPVLSLGANQQVSITPAGIPSMVHVIDSPIAAGLAAGQLSFDDQKVSEVVHRFNLYNRVKIEVLDPALANRRITGVFQANDPQSFIAFIRAATDAPISQPDARHILLGGSSAAGPAK